MEWVNIYSAGMKKIGFDDQQKEFHIKYDSGSYVIYYEVQDSHYIAFLASDDKLDYFEKNIQEKFPSRVLL